MKFQLNINFFFSSFWCFLRDIVQKKRNNKITSAAVATINSKIMITSESTDIIKNSNSNNISISNEENPIKKSSGKKLKVKYKK
jgi:hypothetical protein